jgi:hypothetical protein
MDAPSNAEVRGALLAQLRVLQHDEQLLLLALSAYGGASQQQQQQQRQQQQRQPLHSQQHTLPPPPPPPPAMDASLLQSIADGGLDFDPVYATQEESALSVFGALLDDDSDSSDSDSDSDDAT